MVVSKVGHGPTRNFIAKLAAMHNLDVEHLAANLSNDMLQPGRAVVLGLDGVPHSSLLDLMARGLMPNFSNLAAKGTLRRMKSTLPCVSSVAWTSFRTGLNPGEHGITGFTDREPRTYKTYFPTTRSLTSPTLEYYAANLGMRVMLMGMPVNYPAMELADGVSIGCFLSPALERAVHPKEILNDLKEIGYKIDVNPALATTNPPAFVDEVFQVTEGYRSAMFSFWDKQKWDLMMIHFMTTDRMHHFMWDQYTDPEAPYHREFLALYKRLDEIIGEVAGRLDDDTLLVMLSDHGFCGIKSEVNLNAWLQQKGFLRFQTNSPKSLEDIDGRSLAYSLIPGRFYINLKGREPRGVVEPGAEYDALRRRLAGELLELRNPENGEPVIERVEMRETLYGPDAARVAPDMVALGHYGYDLKDRIGEREIFKKSKLKGMHTYDDAFLFVNREMPIRDGLYIYEASNIVSEHCRCRRPRR